MRIASAMGWLTYSAGQIGMLEAQLTIVLPTALSGLFALADWLLHLWLRSKVTPQARAEPIAVALETAERARATGQPYSIPLGARKAAARVLGKPEPKPRHPTRVTDA